MLTGKSDLSENMVDEIQLCSKDNTETLITQVLVSTHKRNAQNESTATVIQVQINQNSLLMQQHMHLLTMHASHVYSTRITHGKKLPG